MNINLLPKNNLCYEHYDIALYIQHMVNKVLSYSEVTKMHNGQLGFQK